MHPAEYLSNPVDSTDSLFDQAYYALYRTSERIGLAAYREQLAAARKKRPGRYLESVRYQMTEPHQRVQEALNAMTRGKITPEEAMAVLHEYEVTNAPRAR